MREPFEKVAISFEIETCKECAFVHTARTLKAGCATDYHCGFLTTKHVYSDEVRNLPKIMGYVEYSNDEKPVPDWCPIRTDKPLEIATRWKEAELEIQRLRKELVDTLAQR